MSPSDKRHIEAILRFSEELFEMRENGAITRDHVLNDRFTQWAVTTPLYNIGERVAHISVQLKEENPEIPWSKIAGLRHRLVHDYENTSWEIIATVLFDELNEFTDRLRGLS